MNKQFKNDKQSSSNILELTLNEALDKLVEIEAQNALVSPRTNLAHIIKNRYVTDYDKTGLTLCRKCIEEKREKCFAYSQSALHKRDLRVITTHCEKEHGYSASGVKKMKRILPRDKKNPWLDSYNCTLSLGLVTWFSGTNIPFSSADKSLIQTILAHIGSFTSNTMKTAFLQHTSRIRSGLLNTLKGDVCLAVDGSAIKADTSIYVVTLLKGGKSYYLTMFYDDVSKSGKYLYRKLQGLINILRSLGVNTSCVVTDNGRNLVAACEHLDVPRYPCICHGLNLIMKDLLPSKELRNIRQEALKAARAAGKKLSTSTYCETRWLSTTPFMESILNAQVNISVESKTCIATLLPVFKHIEAMTKALEADNTTIVDVWWHIKSLLPNFGHIPGFSDSYLKYYETAIHSDLMDVTLAMLPSYDFAADLAVFNDEYSSQFTNRYFYDKIMKLSEIWGIEMRPAILEEYLDREGVFATSIDKTNTIYDENGEKIDHYARSIKWFGEFKTVVSIPFLSLIEKLQSIVTSEASVERIFSVCRHILPKQANRLSYPYIDAKLFLRQHFKDYYDDEHFLALFSGETNLPSDEYMANYIFSDVNDADDSILCHITLNVPMMPDEYYNDAFTSNPSKKRKTDGTQNLTSQIEEPISNQNKRIMTRSQTINSLIISQTSSGLNESDEHDIEVSDDDWQEISEIEDSCDAI